MSRELHLNVAKVELSTKVRDNIMESEELTSRYEMILSEYGPGLSRLASSYEYLSHAREDLLQDIHLALWSALPNFRGECSLRTFVYRIAHNRGLTHVWKRKGRPQVMETEEDIPEIMDPRADPESSAIQRADHLKLMRAIRGLPVPYRQMITLVLEDFAQSEMAAVLGISENNVAVRLNRARKMLRERLGGNRE